MYLHKLEKDEKTAFLAFARHLAQVDDSRIDDAEKYMLKYMCIEMGLEATDCIAEPYDEEKVLKVFYRVEARRVLILEGVGICYANGTLDGSQRAALNALAAKFHLDEDFVSRAISLAEQQLKIMDEFDRLIEQG